MTHIDIVLSPTEAARQLGVSSKTLRLYEERGLVRSIRNEAGWRHYGPREIDRVRMDRRCFSLCSEWSFAFDFA